MVILDNKFYDSDCLWVRMDNKNIIYEFRYGILNWMIK